MKGRKRSAPTGGTPTSVKEYRAELALALKDAGVPLQTFLDANDKTRYPVKKTALYDHVAAIKSGESPFKQAKQSGRPPALTDADWDVVCGAILRSKSPADLSWIQRWIRDNFAVELDLSNISRHLKDKVMTWRLASWHPISKGSSMENYVQQAYEWVLTLHNSGFFKHPPHKIVCIDTCFNSYRLDRQKTFNILGGRQRKFSSPTPVYTSAYVACVSMKDEAQYPALMFTRDPAFNPRGQRWTEVLEWCEKWGINPSRIVFSAEGKKYWGEGRDIYGHFKSVYREELAGTRVLHDGGPAFKIGDEFIFADGADRLEVFPSDPHGELSVLDNNFFGMAKSMWRAERPREDFSKAALYLLWCMDWVSKTAVEKMWRYNFALDMKPLSLAAFSDRIRGGRNQKKASATLQRRYQNAYTKWAAERDQDNQ